MTPVRTLVVVLLVGGLLLTCIAWAQTNEIAITIAPATLVLTAPVQWVTVHTNLPFGAVDQDTVQLDGIEMAWAKADARGQFVAKFVFDDVADLVAGEAPGLVTLTLTGVASDEAFAGSDEIMVK